MPMWPAQVDAGFIVFSYHPQAKQWSVLEEHFAGVAPDYDLHGARNLALSPDQTRLYVSAWHSDAITVYRSGCINRDGKSSGESASMEGYSKFQ